MKTNNMTKDMKQLKRKIMRRVYYAYSLSIVTASLFWQGVFLGAVTLVLGDWLHVASIEKNLLATPLGQLPTYIAGSFVHAWISGEVMTVLMILAAAVISVSVGYKLAGFVFGRNVVFAR